MSDVFIETKQKAFTNATGTPPTLTISLNGPHKTLPVVTIGHEEEANTSSYNFFINEIISTGLLTYDIIIGVSGADGSLIDSATDPVIYIHAMSYV